MSNAEGSVKNFILNRSHKQELIYKEKKNESIANFFVSGVILLSSSNASLIGSIMLKKWIVIQIFILVFSSVFTLSAPNGSPRSLDTPNLEVVNHDSLENSQEIFVENLGQFEDGFRFVGETSFGRIGFMDSKIIFDLKGDDGGTVLEYSFPSSNKVEPAGQVGLPGKYNYFIGNDPDRWIIGAKSFRMVFFEDLWDGIDLRYTISGGSPKYEFVVHPNGEPNEIRMDLRGHDSLRIFEDQIWIDSGSGFLKDGGLYTFQPGTGLSIRSSFLEFEKDSIGFDIGEYDTSMDLIIDPEITYSALIGGAEEDYGVDLIVDDFGYLYVLGRTTSTDFPTTTGSYLEVISGDNDLFIFKMDPSGSNILATTYFGGSNGNEYQRCGMAIGTDGNILISGDTRSDDLPTTTGAYDIDYNGAGDIYVASLGPDLDSLVFSTYLGAHETEYFGAIAVADDGSIIITGGTESTDYPVSTDAYDQEKGESSASYEDVVVSRLNQAGTTLLNSTFIGGDGDERGTSLHLNDQGYLYVGGWTSAADFPTTSETLDDTQNGESDCFVCVLDFHLKGFYYGTYFGGSDDEGGGDLSVGMKVTDSGVIYLAGQTSSTDLPTSISSFQQNLGGGSGSDSFIVSFIDNTLLGCTYVGGTDSEFTMSMDIDYQENVIIAGASKSTDYPLTPDGQYKTNKGGDFFGDCVISIVSPDLSSLYYSTYYGGDSNDLIYKVKATNDGSLYFCGISISSDIPTTNDFGAPEDSSGNVMVLVSGGFSARDPLEIYSMNIYSDPDYNNHAYIIDRGETVYFQITGRDANDTTRDGTRVNLTFSKGSHLNISVWLRETDLATGVYRSSFRIPITVAFFENVTVYADKDPSKKKTFTVDTPVRLNLIPPKIIMKEHENLTLEFSNLGWFEDAEWHYTTNSPWIDFNNDTHSINETPLNPDVGTWKIWVNITDRAGNFSEVMTSITVNNIAPVLLGENRVTVNQGDYYYMDYNSDEDGEGGIEYVLISDADWLQLNETNGILNGTSEQDDVGSLRVGVVVRDGNGGSDDIYFDLEVLNVNDPPIILTSDILEVNQGDPFQRKYEASDIDPGDVLTWSIVTDAPWLAMNNITGILSGTPGPEDVKDFTINVTVTDIGGMSDSHEFILTVNNINDQPYFVDVPSDVEVISGRMFSFQINASDFDPDTELQYSAKTTPRTEFYIDPDTGSIEWEATIDIFDQEPYILYIEITVSDGELEAIYEFEIHVKKTQPPTATLISPQDGMRASYRKPVIRWEGSDPENEPLTFDVYLGENQVFVLALKQETLFISGYMGTSAELSGLEAGKTYHWLVIPFDGGSYGTCLSNSFSFDLNSPPKIAELGMQEAVSGEQFKLLIQAQDDDQGDLTKLRYSIDEGPTGMIIGEHTGLITWTPTKGQELLFNVIINVTDGIDYTQKSFVIEVTSPEKSEDPSAVIPIFIGVIILILIATIVIVFIVIRRKKQSEDELEPENGYGSEFKESQPQRVSDVPLTTAEAHAHLGKGSKKISYEELYGVKAPEKDTEGMTTTELRNYIRGQISELEKSQEGEEVIAPEGIPKE